MADELDDALPVATAELIDRYTRAMQDIGMSRSETVTWNAGDSASWTRRDTVVSVGRVGWVRAG